MKLPFHSYSNILFISSIFWRHITMYRIFIGSHVLCTSCLLWSLVSVKHTHIDIHSLSPAYTHVCVHQGTCIFIYVYVHPRPLSCAAIPKAKRSCLSSSQQLSLRATADSGWNGEERRWGERRRSAKKSSLKEKEFLDLKWNCLSDCPSDWRGFMCL